MKTLTRNNAFTLVEVTLALGVALFCLITVFALLPTGVNSNKASLEQTAATSVLRAITADLRATPNPLPYQAQTSAQFGISIPAAGEPPAPVPPLPIYIGENEQSGTSLASVTNPRYLLSVWMTPPTAAGSRQATLARLLLTWPSAATTTNALGSVETVIALDRN